MKSSAVKISFNDELLANIDKVAQQESRSRSELIREAVRAYIKRKNKWNQIFLVTEKFTKKNNITEKDINQEISKYRIEAGKS